MQTAEVVAIGKVVDPHLQSVDITPVVCSNRQFDNYQPTHLRLLFKRSIIDLLVIIGWLYSV